MTLTREVSLQTLAVLDQAETGIERLMGSGQPDQVAVAIRYLLRLLTSSSSRLQVRMALDQQDTDEQLSPRHSNPSWGADQSRVVGALSSNEFP